MRTGPGAGAHATGAGARPRTLRLLTFFCVVLAAGPASALRRCGDDVDGGAVPCACGDLLVGSHRLDAADPVTTARCPGN
ncbi:MAG: hypothetical protein E6J56_18945, partial [Deltaproteobacteria bacterium]